MKLSYSLKHSAPLRVQMGRSPRKAADVGRMWDRSGLYTGRAVRDPKLRGVRTGWGKRLVGGHPSGGLGQVKGDKGERTNSTATSRPTNWDVLDTLLCLYSTGDTVIKGENKRVDFHK